VNDDVPTAERERRVDALPSVARRIGRAIGSEERVRNRRPSHGRIVPRVPATIQSDAEQLGILRGDTDRQVRF
jgi:hypothetical protein